MLFLRLLLQYIINFSYYECGECFQLKHGDIIPVNTRLELNTKTIISNNPCKRLVNFNSACGHEDKVWDLRSLSSYLESSCN